MSTSHNIKYEILDYRISYAIIYRPEKLNAFTLEIYKEFTDMILKVEEN